MKFPIELVMSILNQSESALGGLVRGGSLLSGQSGATPDNSSGAETSNRSFFQTIQYVSQGKAAASKGTETKDTVDKPSASETPLPMEAALSVLAAQQVPVQLPYNLVSTTIIEPHSDQEDTEDIHYLKLSLDDIKGLEGLLQPPPLLPNLAIQGAGQANPNATGVMYRSLGGSEAFMQTLQSAYKQNRPVRIDFDATSVILRFNKQGTVHAEFVPNDKATELYVKQHLAELKQRLESKALPEATFSIRQSSDQPSQQQQQSSQDTQDSTES